MKVILLLLLPVTIVRAESSFRELLKDYIQKDPAFKEVDLETPVFEAQVKQGFSKMFLPRLGLNYGFYEQHNNVSIATSEDRWRFGSLTASFDVFSFGRDWNNFQATRYQLRSQEEKVNAQLLRRESEIAVLVLEYLRSAKNLEIFKKLVDLKERSLDLSKSRYERGNLSEQDYNKVKLDVSNVRGEQLSALQEYNDVLARAQAYGLDTLPASYPWENELSTTKVKNLLKTSTAVTDLPQFRETELAFVASDYRKASSLSALMGNISLNFSRSYYRFEDDRLWEWRASVVYTLPLFEQFDQYTTYARNDAFRRINDVRRDFQKNLSEKTQAARATNLELSLKNWAERRDALKVSTRLYTDSLRQFNNGKLSVNELLVDQDRLFRTEIIANQALFQLHSSALFFCHSQGISYVKGCF